MIPFDFQPAKPSFHTGSVTLSYYQNRFHGPRLRCRLSLLLVQKIGPVTLHRGKKLELPTDSGTGLLNYLKRAAALDPAPSPLEATIRQLEAQLAVPTVNQ